LSTVYHSIDTCWRLWSTSLILISADRCRNTRTDQWICCWLPSRVGAQDLL